MIVQEGVRIKKATTAIDEKVEILSRQVNQLSQMLPGFNDHFDTVLLRVEALELQNTPFDRHQKQSDSSKNRQHCLKGKAPIRTREPKISEIQVDDPNLTLQPVQWKSCSCRKQVQRRSWVLSSKTWNVSSSNFQIATHAPDCPYWNSSQHYRSTSYSAYWISTILGKAIQATVLISVNAYGSCISPNLTIRPVVSKDAPAFALVSQKAVSRKRGDLSEYLMDVTSSIIQLYKDRKASPYDLNERGETILLVRTS